MMDPFLVLLLCIHFALGQEQFLDQIQRLYLQQGIPFRENRFLDNLPILSEYDFVIVGSGPAGSSIANRLTEVPHWKVLLLEAGFEGNIYNDIPVINEFTVLGNFSINYDVEREDTACLGLVDQRCHWPSGNGIGGASLINAMIFTRGHPSDFDNWAYQGNPGWSYEEVLPYFKKLETMSVPELANPEYHGTSGPVNIQYPFQTRLGKLFVEAGLDLGYDRIDYNSPNRMIGVSTTQASMKGVRRDSAASAYLLPVKSRSNLHVVKNAFVTEVIIDEVTKKAVGVKFIKNDEERTVSASREVVLSAGAFGSPKLLMLSGIGPAEHLYEMGIRTIVDLPVGNNLQEHLGTVVTFLINTTDSVTTPKLTRAAPSELLKWINGQYGILASNIAEALGYVQTKYAEDDRPEIELIFFPITMGGDGGLFWPKTRNISSEIYSRTFGQILFQEGFSIAPMIMYPKSKGNIRLRSSNPRDPIVIDSNFYSEPHDVAVLTEGARIAMQFEETNSFKKVGARVYREPIYGCGHFKFNSDEYWDCAIRSITAQFHHQCGTCRMGPDPLWSVVDPRLRVYGVSGLRVADASIMPSIPGTHTMAPSYMIGEKAADMIKEDWGVL